MLSLKFFKGLPTDYVIKYVNGRPVVEGVGLTFSYLRHNTQIVVVPVSSRDGDIAFVTVTSDLQAVAIQVQFLYRVNDPHQAASQFNFSIDTARKSRVYLSRDVEKLTQRASNLVQSEMTEQIQRYTLENLLYNLNDVALCVQQNVNISPMVKNLGIEILNVFLISARPRTDINVVGSEKTTPETTLASSTFSGQKATTDAAAPLALPRATDADAIKYGRRSTDVPTDTMMERRGRERRDQSQTPSAPNADSSTPTSDAEPEKRNAESDKKSAEQGKQNDGTYLFVATEAARGAKRQAEENRRRSPLTRSVKPQLPDSTPPLVPRVLTSHANGNEQPKDGAASNF